MPITAISWADDAEHDIHMLRGTSNDWLEVEAIEFETIIINKGKNESRRSGARWQAVPLFELVH